MPIIKNFGRWYFSDQHILSRKKKMVAFIMIGTHFVVIFWLITSVIDTLEKKEKDAKVVETKREANIQKFHSDESPGGFHPGKSQKISSNESE